MSKLFYGYRSREHIIHSLGEEKALEILESEDRTVKERTDTSGRKYRIIEVELPTCTYRIREEVKEKKSKKKDE